MEIHTENQLLIQWQKELIDWSKFCKKKEILNRNLSNVLLFLSAGLLSLSETLKIFNPVIIQEITTICNFLLAIIISLSKIFQFDKKTANYASTNLNCSKLSDEILFQLNESTLPSRDLIEFTGSVKAQRENLRLLIN